jgi:hypothetical protein
MRKHELEREGKSVLSLSLSSFGQYMRHRKELVMHISESGPILLQETVGPSNRAWLMSAA